MSILSECIDTSELVAQTQVEAQTAEIDGVKVKHKRLLNEREREFKMTCGC